LLPTELDEEISSFCLGAVVVERDRQYKTALFTSLTNVNLAVHLPGKLLASITTIADSIKRSTPRNQSLPYAKVLYKNREIKQQTHTNER
jgi:hypothetical protein